MSSTVSLGLVFVGNHCACSFKLDSRLNCDLLSCDSQLIYSLTFVTFLLLPSSPQQPFDNLHLSQIVSVSLKNHFLHRTGEKRQNNRGRGPKRRRHQREYATCYSLSIHEWRVFQGEQSSHDTLTGGEELLLNTSHLLPTPDVNISYHIMRQALEQEFACGSLGGSDKLAEGKQESRKRKERERMTGGVKQTNATTIYSTIMLALRFWEAGATNVWGRKRENKTRLNG